MRNNKAIIGSSIITASIFVLIIIYMNVNRNVTSLGFNRGYDNISIVKSYDGKLSSNRECMMVKKIVKDLGGKILYTEKRGMNQRVVYGYTPFVNNKVVHKGKDVNLNIVVTYMEDMNATSIHLGTPVVNMDY